MSCCTEVQVRSIYTPLHSLMLHSRSYTSWPPAHLCSSFVFIWNRHSSIFMEWFFYTTLQRVITSTAFYTAVPLLSIFSCLKALFDFVVHADRRLFFHYVLISPVMERWADSLVPLWTSVLKLKPAPGWINRSCTFGFDGAPRVAHLTVVGLGSAGFQCYFDL